MPTILVQAVQERFIQLPAEVGVFPLSFQINWKLWRWYLLEGNQEKVTTDFHIVTK